MEICYDGALVMPSNYVVVGEEEMIYLEGGGSATVYGTAANIRSRLTKVIGASLAGTGSSVALGALVGGGAAGAIIGAVVGHAWFGAYRSCASSAHAQVEKIIAKYNTKKKCVMTTTYSFACYCTGINVKVA